MKRNKLAFVLGGNGVIGREIVKRLHQSGIKVIILDIKIDKKLLNDNVLFFNFDSSKLNTVEKKFNKLISKYKCPDIFINTSYPYSKEWGKITFENLKTTQLRKNVDIHMNSFAWTSLKIAQEYAIDKDLIYFQPLNDDKSIVDACNKLINLHLEISR